MSGSEGRFGPDWKMSFEFPVERGKILEFARALKSTLPAFFGEHAVAPPTFLAAGAQIWGYSWEQPGDSILADWGVNAKNVLHLEEEYRFSGPPLRAGDLLSGTTRLREPVKKVGRRAGPMTLLELFTEYRGRAGDLVATAQQLVVRRDALDSLGTALEQGVGASPAPASAPAALVAADSGEALASAIPSRRHGPLTLEDCVTYQAASGDLSPQHYDPEILRESGFSTFFSPGMLQAGLMSIPVAEAFGPESIRRIRFRFAELVDIGEMITCSAAVAEDQHGDDDAITVVDLACTRSDGVVAVTGQAEVGRS